MINVNLNPHETDLIICGLPLLATCYVLVRSRYKTTSSFIALKLCFLIIGWATFFALALSATLQGKVTGFPFSNPAPGLWTYITARFFLSIFTMMYLRNYRIRSVTPSDN